jgi:hypothetical protein
LYTTTIVLASIVLLFFATISCPPYYDGNVGLAENRFGFQSEAAMMGWLSKRLLAHREAIRSIMLAGPPRSAHAGLCPREVDERTRKRVNSIVGKMCPRFTGIKHSGNFDKFLQEAQWEYIT